ncbi:MULTISPECIES: aconitase X swivel domain-containing protein [unclassified Arthrobacter]|uniref:aconitase X swivel domain-containing protein n=1 Tax=unclassified Arthrobacter TaxID=235627 RepID=UPI0015E3C98F|nr:MULTISPECIES: DUF126 domain-containing protein [unclassified Arthrobacter]
MTNHQTSGLQIKASPSEFILKHATGEKIIARALVSTAPFSARYDLNRVEGTISRKEHPLRGHQIAGQIFVAPGVQGGVAGGWALLDMGSRQVGFAGLILGRTNPVMVQGAVTAGIPIAAGISEAFFATVKTGDLIELCPDEKTVRILEG